MPKPLFTKLIAQAAIGFFCILIGCSYGMYSRDKIFLIMSVLIGFFCMIRTISLYQLIQTKSYRTLTGTCIKQESAMLKKVQTIRFLDENQQEHFLSFNKEAKFLQGHHYRLYFKESSFLDKNILFSEDSLSSSSFLGYEELSHYSHKEEA